MKHIIKTLTEINRHDTLDATDHEVIQDVINELESIASLLHELVYERMEYLRAELRAERISYEEILELQRIAKYIPKEDKELLEAAGVPEHDEQAGREEKILEIRTQKEHISVYATNYGYLFEQATESQVITFECLDNDHVNRELEARNWKKELIEYILINI